MAHGITSFWLMAAPFELSASGDTGPAQELGAEEPLAAADNLEPECEEVELIGVSLATLRGMSGL